MKKLVFFPSDPIKAYIEKGRTYDFLDNYYNPAGFFDEVYCLSPWGDKDYETIGKIHYIKAKPEHFSKIIKRIKPDVVRGYGGYCCADWVSISKVKGIPTVVSVHDTNPELIHQSLAYADEIICMSQAVKDAVQKLVPNVTSNIWVMPNRIDINIYKKKDHQKYFEKLNHCFPGKKHLLHIGRKTKQKNLDTLIEALKYLDDDVVCIFVGRGELQKYQKLAENVGVLDRCFWVDRVASEELPYWYSWCDCFCTPSRWEGFGYVFIEAAACESLIVTSNIGPMNEYLTNMENAILVDDYENPEEIAKAIQWGLNNKIEAEKIKKNARSVGLAFSKNSVDAQEVALYEKAMSLVPNNQINKQLLKSIRCENFRSIVGKIKGHIKLLILFPYRALAKYFGRRIKN